MSTNLHIAWAELLLHAAWCAGVRDVVLSPGSRSTPLALAAHHSRELRSHVIVDERAAAFFALGQARLSGRPTLLACTSGTAAAHYYPAVIEASMSALPLLVVTADRPWELQHTHASQTIDQTRLFGPFARQFLALGAPEPSPAALRALARTAAQAVARSLAPEPGPVHINAPFRKPLEPAAQPEPEPWTAAWQALMTSGPTRSITTKSALDKPALDDLAALCDGAERGLILCGPSPASGDLAAHRRALTALATATGFPILPEATSQSRFGLTPSIIDTSMIEGSMIDASITDASITATSITDASTTPTSIIANSITATSITDASISVLSAFDALLRSASFRADFVPDLILELGAPPTSAGYAQLLAEHPSCRRVVAGPLGWTDPASTATAIVHTDVAPFAAALAATLQARDATLPAARRRARAAWARSLAGADSRARALVDADLPTARDAALTEAATARAVVAACPAGSVLVLGNSSPVRDADLFCHASATPLRVLHQRGAAGIDGLVAGAAGARSVAATAVSLLLGDVSLLHDLTSLVLTRPSPPDPNRDPQPAAAPLVITVINNDGGRIFEQLPIGPALQNASNAASPIASPTIASPAITDPAITSSTITSLAIAIADPAITSFDAFERCFATPQRVDFAAAAAAFGIAHVRAASNAELAAALAAAHAGAGATLIEAMVPPHDGAARSRALWKRIDASLPSRKEIS